MNNEQNKITITIHIKLHSTRSRAICVFILLLLLRFRVMVIRPIRMIYTIGILFKSLISMVFNVNMANTQIKPDKCQPSGLSNIRNERQSTPCTH